MLEGSQTCEASDLPSPGPCSQGCPIDALHYPEVSIGHPFGGLNRRTIGVVRCSPWVGQASVKNA